jgi:hypothetical protein
MSSPDYFSAGSVGSAQAPASANAYVSDLYGTPDMMPPSGLTLGTTMAPMFTTRPGADPASEISAVSKGVQEALTIPRARSFPAPLDTNSKIISHADNGLSILALQLPLHEYPPDDVVAVSGILIILIAYFAL